MNAYDPAPNPGDDNVARLLDQAYDPPAVPADFAERVRQRMLAVAAERQPPATPRRPAWLPRRFARVAAAAALLGCIAAGFQFLAPKSKSNPGNENAER